MLSDKNFWHYSNFYDWVTLDQVPLWTMWLHVQQKRYSKGPHSGKTHGWQCECVRSDSDVFNSYKIKGNRRFWQSKGLYNRTLALSKTQDTREVNHLLNTQSWNRYDDVQSTLLVYQVKCLREMKLNIITTHKPGVIT